MTELSASGAGVNRKWTYRLARTTLPTTLTPSTPKGSTGSPGTPTATNSLAQPTFTGTGVSGTGILMINNKIPLTQNFPSTLTLAQTVSKPGCPTQNYGGSGNTSFTNIRLR